MATERERRRQRVKEEAALWAVRLSSADCPATDRAALEIWLDADPAHEVAYAQASAALARTDRLRALRPPGEPDPDVLAAPAAINWSGPPAEARPQPAISRPPLPTRRAAVAAGLAVLAGGGAYLAMGRGSKAYATTIGQRARVRLDDGTRMELNTDTAVQVRLGLLARRVDMARGEVLFDVQPDHRAFTVDVAGHQVDAARASFVVRREDARLRVMVLGGDVRLTGIDYDLRLQEGGIADIGPSGAATRKAAPGEMDRDLSWRNGAINFAGEPLSEAVNEFNRYNARKLMVGDPSLAGLRVGGYFQSNDPIAFAEAVRQSFALRTVDRGGVVYFMPGERAP